MFRHTRQGFVHIPLHIEQFNLLLLDDMVLACRAVSAESLDSRVHHDVNMTSYLASLRGSMEARVLLFDNSHVQ